MSNNINKMSYFLTAYSSLPCSFPYCMSWNCLAQAKHVHGDLYLVNKQKKKVKKVITAFITNANLNLSNSATFEI